MTSAQFLRKISEGSEGFRSICCTPTPVIVRIELARTRDASQETRAAVETASLNGSEISYQWQASGFRFDSAVSPPCC
jgi:hypothetical protein